MWEAPANADPTTREPCQAERTRRRGAFTEGTSSPEKELQEVDSDTQRTHKPRDNTNGLACTRVTEADATASDLGGSEGRVKGAMKSEKSLQGLINDSQDWSPEEGSPGPEVSVLLGQVAPAAGKEASSSSALRAASRSWFGEGYSA